MGAVGGSGAAEGYRVFCGNLESILLPLPTLCQGWLIELGAQLCHRLPFLLVDPCEPQESSSASGSDIGSYWRKGKQEGEHVSVNKGELSLVGTRCKVAFSPLGGYCGLKV